MQTAVMAEKMSLGGAIVGVTLGVALLGGLGGGLGMALAMSDLDKEAPIKWETRLLERSGHEL